FVDHLMCDVNNIEHLIDFDSHWINLSLNFDEYTSKVSRDNFLLNINKELKLKF
ncbi:hypothetical protein V1478_015096, partial [Vespula squamosa]